MIFERTRKATLMSSRRIRPAVGDVAVGARSLAYAGRIRSRRQRVVLSAQSVWDSPQGRATRRPTFLIASR